MLQVYCWRGGNRSASLAHVLSQIGFDVAVLSRGYNGYRKQVMATASSGRVDVEHQTAISQGDKCCALQHKYSLEQGAVLQRESMAGTAAQ